MAKVITILTLILFISVVICAIGVLMMAIITIFRPRRRVVVKEVAHNDESVQLYFRKDELQGKIESPLAAASSEESIAEPVVEETKTDFIEDRLAGLPNGYHILTELELNLPVPVEFKGSQLKFGKIDFLIIGPRRIYVLKVAPPVKPNFKKLTADIEIEARLVESFLSQKLDKDFRVCGWLVANSSSSTKSKYKTKIHSKDEIVEAIIKYERSSQGKSKSKASESVPEIISELKLARWEAQKGEATVPLYA